MRQHQKGVPTCGRKVNRLYRLIRPFTPQQEHEPATTSSPFIKRQSTSIPSFSQYSIAERPAGNCWVEWNRHLKMDRKESTEIRTTKTPPKRKLIPRPEGREHSSDIPPSRRSLSDPYVLGRRGEESRSGRVVNLCGTRTRKGWSPPGYLMGEWWASFDGRVRKGHRQSGDRPPTLRTRYTPGERAQSPSTAPALPMNVPGPQWPRDLASRGKSKAP